MERTAFEPRPVEARDTPPSPLSILSPPPNDANKHNPDSYERQEVSKFSFSPLSGDMFVEFGLTSLYFSRLVTQKIHIWEFSGRFVKPRRERQGTLPPDMSRFLSLFQQNVHSFSSSLGGVPRVPVSQVSWVLRDRPHGIRESAPTRVTLEVMVSLKRVSRAVSHGN